jgi:hypothetical protein
MFAMKHAGKFIWRRADPPKNRKKFTTKSIGQFAHRFQRIIPRQQVQVLTVTGLYRPIDSERIKEQVETKLLHRHPHLIDFISHPDTAILGINL